jgi:hypothetical protein
MNKEGTMSLLNPLNVQDALRVTAAPVVRVDTQTAQPPPIEPPKPAPREEKAALDRRDRERRQRQSSVTYDRRNGVNRRARCDDEAQEESALGTAVNLRV